MIYRVGDYEVKSHNTAKPASQNAKSVSSYLQSHDYINNVLDFGCGKLRYSPFLYEIAESITFVDSKLQLNRTQIVHGVRTSVKNYILEKYKKAKVVNYEDLSKENGSYDFIFCANVISAIPCKDTIDNILDEVYRLLKEDGKAVFINQHRNSYFKKFMSGTKHLFGYLYKVKEQTSYYGIIDNSTMEKLCLEHNFTVKKKWVDDQISFLEVCISA